MTRDNGDCIMRLSATADLFASAFLDGPATMPNTDLQFVLDSAALLFGSNSAVFEKLC